MTFVFIHGEFGSLLPPPWINLSPTLPPHELSVALSSCVKPVTLVGHSYGAFKAMHVTGYDKLILLAPIGLTPRLGLFGQLFAVFFRLFGSLSSRHIQWRGCGFEWIDVVRPPKDAVIYFGAYDLIIPSDPVIGTVLSCGHAFDGFRCRIEEINF